MAPSYVYEPQSEGPPNKKTAQPQWQNGFVRAQLRLPGVAVASQACPSCGEKCLCPRLNISSRLCVWKWWE